MTRSHQNTNLPKSISSV